MNSVAFLQQQVWEIDQQIAQLIDKRAELTEAIQNLRDFVALQKYNLPKPDDQV